MLDCGVTNGMIYDRVKWGRRTHKTDPRQMELLAATANDDDGKKKLKNPTLDIQDQSFDDDSSYGYTHIWTYAGQEQMVYGQDANTNKKIGIGI